MCAKTEGGDGRKGERGMGGMEVEGEGGNERGEAAREREGKRGGGRGRERLIILYR